MMEELLKQLTKAACLEQAVASTTMDNGMHMLAFPFEQGVLVALGYGPELTSPAQQEALLRRRAENLARFGAWLPALFNDGSWYVVRRVLQISPDTDDMAVLSGSELAVAEDLLA